MNFIDGRSPGAQVLGEMTLSDLVRRSQKYLRMAFGGFLLVLLAGALAALINGGMAYLAGYVLIVTGLTPPIALWIYSVRRNIPLVPSLALVNLVWNALPLAFGNPQLAKYTEDEILRGSGEVLVFGVALTLAYMLVSSAPASRPREYMGVALSKFRSRQMVLGAALGALAFCVVLEYLLMTGVVGRWLVRMPVGTYSVIRILQDALKLSSGFVLAYCYAAGYIQGMRKLLVFSAWISLFIMALAPLLLSSAAGLTIAIAAGLYLGSGRIPWKYIVLVMVVVSFFNYSKHEMRKKYWKDSIGAVQVHEMPAYFAEWTALTFEMMVGQHDRMDRKDRDGTQGLLERVSTLQMLLYVQRMMHAHQIPALNGETYAIIPKLLVPRILWPDKPRTHQGQVLLNTHFGRQTLKETHRTYIAWGLIAESYGNFGSIFGPLILGLVLGAFLTSIEVWSGNYPLLSIRGALATALLLQVLVSYEMTAAILVTSSSQLLLLVLVALLLLAGRHKIARTA